MSLTVKQDTTGLRGFRQQQTDIAGKKYFSVVVSGSVVFPLDIPMCVFCPVPDVPASIFPPDGLTSFPPGPRPFIYLFVVAVTSSICPVDNREVGGLVAVAVSDH